MRRGRDATRPSLDRDAFASILGHDFPGNIRELENLLEGAAALSQGGTIRREDLQWLPQPGLRLAEAAPALGEDEIPDLRALENRHIQRVLRLAGGNKSRAARLLGHFAPDALPEAPGGTLGHWVTKSHIPQ